MASTDARERLNVLRKLLADGKLSTQEELVEELSRMKFDVTQSTISRDLRRIGAAKTIDPSGNTVYKLGPSPVSRVAVPQAGLKHLLIDIKHNSAMIVIHTSVGSASMVAAHLDHIKPEGILGTIAGDDTIFVAPESPGAIKKIIKTIYDSL